MHDSNHSLQGFSKEKGYYQKNPGHSHNKGNSNIQKLISRSNNDLLNSTSSLKPKSTLSLNHSEQSNHYSSIDSRIDSTKNSSRMSSLAQNSSRTDSKKYMLVEEAAFNEITNEIFHTDWVKQKNLYFSIQTTFLVFNFILTMVVLGLSLWINLDSRFQFVTDLGDKDFNFNLKLVFYFNFHFLR